MENILEKINKATLKFLVPLTLQETYETIVQEAMRLVGAEIGSIFLAKGDVLERVYASSPLLYHIKPRSRGFTYTTFKTRQPLVIDNTKVVEVHPQIKELGVKTTVLIPLSYRNQSRGVLSVDSPSKESFTSSELDALKLFGSLAMLAIVKTQLYDETRKALEARDEFISMAAHELRTPLTPISGYVQLLQKKFALQDSVEAKWIRELGNETMKLTHLVNEIVTVSRIKSGKLDYQWKKCNITEVVSSAVLQFESSNRLRKIVVDNQLPNQVDTIIADSDKLGQVFISLLDNASNYSPQDRDIYICLKYKSPNLFVCITDYGRGISKADMTRIFETFYRGKTVVPEGMGLGLFLVQKIVSDHHGTVRALSRVNRGTTIEVKLPRAKI